MIFLGKHAPCKPFPETCFKKNTQQKAQGTVVFSLSMTDRKRKSRMGASEGQMGAPGPQPNKLQRSQKGRAGGGKRNFLLSSAPAPLSSESLFGERGDAFSSEISQFVWKRMKSGGSAPEPRFGHAQALGRGKGGGDGFLFVFGGGRESLFDDCHVLNLQTHKWQPLECAGHQPPPRSRHTAPRAGQAVIVYGGTGWGVTDDLYALDLKAQEGRKMEPRGRHARG